MDLKLEQIPMEGYICPLDTTLYQEETQESIVPDACPDILSIVAAEGCAQLLRKECGDGKGEVSGAVRVNVLYIPEGEEGARCLTVSVPFRTAVTAPGLTAAGVLMAAPRVTRAEARTLNPRKILVRVELAVPVQGWAPQGESLCAPCGETEVALQQRTEDVEQYATVAAVEKAFAFSDEVTIGASRPGVRELLGHRLGLHCAEAKVIGSKLVMKGEAVLEVRYLTAENTLAVGRWELPFSQIVEAGAADEDASCAVEVAERDSQVALAGGEEDRTLSVHLELLAQAVARATRTATVFADAYSVSHAVTVERRSCTFTQLYEENTLQQVVREVSELPETVQEVQDCHVALSCPQIERDGEGYLLTSRGTATALCAGEEGQLLAAEVPFTAQCRVAAPEGAVCRARCAVGSEVQAVAAAGGVEVRVPVQFSYLTTVERTCSAVAALSAEEREETEERPSVILRLALPGESLWDIAKAYATTEDDILAANELPGSGQLEGTLLLIPRSR